MEDNREEHLDRLSGLFAFLCKKYEVPMPELELDIVALSCEHFEKEC